MGVQLFLFALLALILAVFQHAWCAAYWWTPDLGLALVAWAMVDGDAKGMPDRAFVAGLARDLAEPGGWGFHLLVYLGLACALLPVRDLLFRQRFAAWAMWSGVAFLVQVGAEIAWSGTIGERTGWPLVIQGIGTVLTAVAVGWLFGGLPARWRLVPVAGA